MKALVRELDTAAIRLVLRTSSASILEAIDRLLPPRPVEAAATDREEIELSEGSTALHASGRSLTVDVAAGELPGALRGIIGSVLDRRGGALLHGAAALIGEQAVLCIAPSEGGKTTLCGKLAGRLTVLSDETVALRLDGEGPTVSGTPFWSGPPLPTRGGRFPLAAICFLRKAAPRLTPLARSAALSELLREWHLPERAGASGDALARAEALISQIPVFELSTALESDPLPLLQAAVAFRMREAV